MGNRNQNTKGRPGRVAEGEISERDERWYRDWMAGRRQSDIADSEGVARQTVNRAIQRVERITAGLFLADIKKYRDRCTLRLEHLYSEAVREWERSKLPAVSDKIGQNATVSTDEFDGEKPSFFIERTTKSQTGSPALHKAARETLKDLMELHGIRFIEERPADEEEDDIAGLTTGEQVDIEIRKHQGDIARLRQYRELVAMTEGEKRDPDQSAVAAEREQVLEASDDWEAEGQAPD